MTKWAFKDRWVLIDSLISDILCQQEKSASGHSDVDAGLARFNMLRPGPNGCQFPDGNFKCIFFNENISIVIKISLKLVPKNSINNNPALVQITTWRRAGDKLLSESIVVRLLTHICVTWPQWSSGNISCTYDKNVFIACNKKVARRNYMHAIIRKILKLLIIGPAHWKIYTINETKMKGKCQCFWDIE